MGSGGGLVAGSGKEFVVINAKDCERKPVQVLGDEICQICGENVEILEFNNNKEFFVACNECAFPVCRPCYEYERREGDQACPQCKTRYKRHKGSARVNGDEEEDEADDLDHEFNSCNADWVFSGSRFNIQNNSQWRDSYSNTRTSVTDLCHPNSKNNTSLPRLTYDGEVDDPDHHALIVPTNSRDLINQVPFQGSCTPLQPRPMIPDRDISLYGYGSIARKKGPEGWKRRTGSCGGAFQGNGLNFEGDEDGNADTPKMDEARQPLSRKLPISSMKINPYRIIIILRLIILGFFFYYRIFNPVENAYALWLTSVICEIWFAISWILDQFSKWCPVERTTFLDRLSLRYEREEEQNQLADIDIFVNMVDHKKEDTLATANTLLSILAVDYPADKVSCYASDDGAAMLTFEALSETSLFAKKWVPFCKKFSIEPRAPECYFKQKMDYLKGKIDPAFVRERRAMKREYEEFKIRINGLISMSQKVPEEGWTMQHGAPWPGNDSQDHPGMVQVFLGHGDSLDENGDNLPRLVYVSRERKPGFNHHKKAGAMNAMMRVSGVLSNGPFILNLKCNHYINNSKALREAMCFMMDPSYGSKVCFVQFPYKFDGDDHHDSYSDRVDFFNINMKGLDGIQGPIYLGTGCVFRRQALYGVEALMKKSREISTQVHSLETILEEVEGEVLEMSSLVSLEILEKKFGLSPAFVASTLREKGRTSKITISASALEEALQAISCGYEDKTAWGKEVGWIYGSVAEDVVTGFKMHCNGWRSVYCVPRRPAFKGSAPANISDYLHLVLRRAMGSVEILLSKHCPIWYGYGGGMKCLQRFSYISLVLYPWTALPLVTYCILPAFCLLTGHFLIPEVSIYSSIIFMAIFASMIATSILEMHCGRLALDDWWRNEQYWVISSVSSHLFALFNGIIEFIVGIEAKFFVACAGDKRDSARRRSMWSGLLIPPLTLLILNVIGIVSGISNAINGSYGSLGPLFGKISFAVWVIVHLYPSLKGMMGKQNRVPTIVLVWSILLASVCSLLWVRLNPFVYRSDGPVLEICGLDCD